MSGVTDVRREAHPAIILRTASKVPLASTLTGWMTPLTTLTKPVVGDRRRSSSKAGRLQFTFCDGAIGNSLCSGADGQTVSYTTTGGLTPRAADIAPLRSATRLTLAVRR